ncbi:hypothetical protein [Sulfitobacter sp. R18_1]|uniref:hypothetical protein n=1 Tax=Sulfitobacter sp. R18_1 TaxID=2821104 RepID=UPI001ADAB188|nr:hypothetical protein [Sulfitobacter sp. R18_1]MBO9428030.1 hypothetical protein [Sulfitobacter sp. R18_1]
MPNTKLNKDDLIPLINKARTGGSLSDNLRASSREHYTQVFKDYETRKDPIVEILCAHMREVLPALSRSGSLAPMASPEGPAPFFSVWQELTEKGWDSLASYYQEELVDCLAGTWVNYIMTNSSSPEDAEAAAQEIVFSFETGTMPLMYGNPLLFQNPSDGELLSVEFDNWTPKVVQVSLDGSVEPPNPGPSGFVFHQTVNFPSGRLLVADAIRVDPIGIFETSLRQKLQTNVNYADHRVKYTGALASYGIVDCMGTDSEPGLVVDPNTGCLFSAPYEDGFEHVAEVCADYHGTTIVDRETLVQMSLKFLPTAGNREEVEARIDRWLASSEFANEVFVDPGEWHLYWDDDRHSVNDALEESSHTCPADIGFVLSPNELDLTHTRLRSFKGTQSVTEEPEGPTNSM